MKTLDYFYENYLLPIFDFLKEMSESACDLFLMFINWILLAVLFLLLPLWIIPYKFWKRKIERIERSAEEDSK